MKCRLISFQSVMEEECEISLIFATDVYKKFIKEKFSGVEKEPVETERLFEYFTTARDKAMDEFNIIGEIREKYTLYPDYVDRLQTYINDQEDKLIEINENLAKEWIKKLE